MSTKYRASNEGATWRPTHEEASVYADHRVEIRHITRPATTDSVRGRLVRWICQIHHDVAGGRFLVSIYSGLSNRELRCALVQANRMPTGRWAYPPYEWQPSKHKGWDWVLELGLPLDDEDALAQLEAMFVDTGDFVQLEVPC